MATNASKKDPAAVKLGRKGGAKSRAYMTKEEASELGRRAAMARWGKVKDKAAQERKKGD